MITFLVVIQYVELASLLCKKNKNTDIVLMSYIRSSFFTVNPGLYCKK